MLREAVESDCLFCVGRLTGAEVPDIASCTAEVGTACLIRASREQSDGRSSLLLHGLCRVRFTEWLPGKPYPFASITTILSEPLEEGQSSDETRRLRQVVEAILLGFPDDLVTKVQQLLDRTSDPGMMSDAISQQFVQDTTLRSVPAGRTQHPQTDRPPHRTPPHSSQRRQLNSSSQDRSPAGASFLSSAPGLRRRSSTSGLHLAGQQSPFLHLETLGRDIALQSRVLPLIRSARHECPPPRVRTS